MSGKGIVCDPTPEQRERAERLRDDILDAIMRVIESYGGDKPGGAMLDVAGLAIELARAAGKVIRPITILDPENAANAVTEAVGELSSAAGFGVTVAVRMRAADGQTKH